MSLEDSGPRRRTVLTAAGTLVSGSLAGCIGAFGTDEADGGRTEQRGDAGGSGRCYAEAQSHLDDSLAVVENVGVLDGEVFVAVDDVAAEVTSYRVFRGDTALRSFDAAGRSRLAWDVPELPFETSYRLVLRDEADERLGQFEFSAECESG
jgi:hypothetical protein